ncbi:MAG TPA: beta-propeller fold lactonase family protein [Frateuria sp.]|uniref:YVTN family beta-propeller repeat protein n=1 Tax=Frateuria sp. TaxID=2211372 RepID=UPI002D803493|nr:beta-propeller fold lactonase family protein [Frateuria sp.]HET6805120.1 beta-propeller fold lactonase family protein [Frateuria sp.]
MPSTRRLLALLAGLLPIAAAQAITHPRQAIYATNEADGTLSVIDARTLQVVDTIPLGKRPRGLQLSPDQRLLFVALSGSPVAGPGVDESKLPPPDHAADGIGVVDLARGKVVRTLRGVSDPEQLALSRDGAHLYVASEDSGKLAVFDVDSGHIVRTLAVGGEPEGVGTSPDQRWVCATSETAGTVALIRALTNTVVHTVKVGGRPRNCRFAADSRRLYVPSETDATLSVVTVPDGKVERVIKLPGAGTRPMGLVLSPDGGTAFVTTGHGGSVLAVDLAQGRVRAAARVGERPWGLALSADGKRLFTADGPSDTVSVVEVDGMRTRTAVKVGGKPWGVATGPLVLDPRQAHGGSHGTAAEPATR